jgi:hypothetical protein
MTLVTLFFKGTEMNYWNKQSIPHKGWMNIGYEDLDEAVHVCDMCGKEEIRYVHTMYHSQVDDYFRVGCICAEKMTNDYTIPKLQLKAMKKKTSWINLNWRKTDLNEYEEKNVNICGFRCEVGVFVVNDKYTFHIDDRVSKFTFDTMRECKEHIYNYYDLGDCK